MLPVTITPTKTPVKKISRVAISPRCKTNKCILCLKYEANQDNSFSKATHASYNIYDVSNKSAPHNRIIAPIIY